VCSICNSQSVRILCCVKTLVIQKEKSQIQSELENANKELAALRGKAVSYAAVE